MPEHRVGTREEWQSARDELLKAENEHAERSEELAKQRTELPWVPVEKDYSFDTRVAPDRDFVVPYSHQLLDRTPKGRLDEFRAWRRDEYHAASYLPRLEEGEGAAVAAPSLLSEATCR